MGRDGSPRFKPDKEIAALRQARQCTDGGYFASFFVVVHSFDGANQRTGRMPEIAAPRGWATALRHPAGRANLAPTRARATRIARGPRMTSAANSA
jgi:hypothetical protein